MGKRGVVTVRLKAELSCRKCGGFWSHKAGTIATECPFCGAFKDARDRTGQGRGSLKSLERKAKLEEWYADPENRKKRGQKQRELLRKKVFFRICGSIAPKCARCTCDDFRLLEVNHKNGGGNREMQSGKFSTRFYYDIASGKRSVDDLELLCKPCNAIHALELKYGPLPMRVVWSSTTPPKSE